MAREEARLSERRACGLLRMHRGSCHYRRRERQDTALRTQLREIEGERPRFGYRRVHEMLRREQENGTAKWVVNHKRVYRIYQEEGLAMRRKKRKRFRAEARVPLVLPTRENQLWKRRCPSRTDCHLGLPNRTLTPIIGPYTFIP